MTTTPSILSAAPSAKGQLEKNRLIVLATFVAMAVGQNLGPGLLPRNQIIQNLAQIPQTMAQIPQTMAQIPQTMAQNPIFGPMFQQQRSNLMNTMNPFAVGVNVAGKNNILFFNFT